MTVQPKLWFPQPLQSGYRLMTGDGIDYLLAYPETAVSDQVKAWPGGGQSPSVKIVAPRTHVVEVDSASDSLQLPSARPGAQVLVHNDGANALSLFPYPGEQIYGSALNAPISVAAGTEVILTAYSWKVWVVSPAGSAGPTLGPSPLYGSQVWSRPNLAAFNTTINNLDSAGQGPLSITDGTGGQPLRVVAPFDINNNRCLSGILKASPGAAPWTITCGVAGDSNFSNNTTNYHCPIILYDGTKAESLAWCGGSGAGGDVFLERWTTLTPNTPGQPSFPSAANVGFSFQDSFKWFQLVNDGTNLTYGISSDGQNFLPVYKEAVGAFLGAITKVGFGMDRFSASTIPTGGVLVTSLWNWTD